MVSTVAADTCQWVSGPARFEAGTPNIAGAIGLMEAVKYLDEVGMEHIAAHVEEVTEYLKQQLGKLDGVTVYAAENNIGIVSFTVEGVHPHDIAQIAGKSGVAIRAGHHCSIPLHEMLGVPATARASVYLYNTKDDVDRLIVAIKHAKETFLV
jgi:cysteine desulfurase/selenocysteine lyase